MGNMSYCRFENTYKDLRDCDDNMYEAESDTEKRYRKRILDLCLDMAERYGDEEFID